MAEVTSSLFDLRCYPSEILGGIIIAKYCDRRDIWNLWCAILGSEEYVEFVWPLLVHNYAHAKLSSIIRDQSSDVLDQNQTSFFRKRTRRKLPAGFQTLIQETLNEDSRSEEFLSLVDQRRYQTRQLVSRLHLVEYYESLHGAVLWSGRMEFSIPRNMRFFRQERMTASVKLCCYGSLLFDSKDSRHLSAASPDAGGCDKEMNAWSFVNLRAWKMSFPEWLSVVQLRSQLYNFVPIPPYGRLQGIDSDDKAVIQKVRLALEESDQVMTLIVRNNRGLILRIISPQQARRRLEAFPSMSSKFERLAATEGLLCCWERTEPWEDEQRLGYTSHEEKLEAIASILTRYQSCRKRYKVPTAS